MGKIVFLSKEGGKVCIVASVGETLRTLELNIRDSPVRNRMHLHLKPKIPMHSMTPEGRFQHNETRMLFTMAEDDTICLDDWVMDENSIAAINEFRSFRGVVSVRDSEVTDIADHSDSYTIRQWFGKDESAVLTEIELGRGGESAVIAGSCALALFGMLLVSRNPQLDEEIELMGIRKPSHWEYSSWFARAFGDLNFTWGRPEGISSQKSGDEFDELDSDGNDVVLWHTKMRSVEGQELGVVLRSSIDQDLGVAVFADNWGKKLYGLY